jgi:adenine-specific DNA methylase
MSKEIGESEEGGRKTLPIEKGFPIERVNEIAEKEARAKMYYRPIYTMHKWWARRLGCVFRTISIYALLDNPEEVEVYEPGENQSLSSFNDSNGTVGELINEVDTEDPESLWSLYNKDLRIKNKKILDPFMGGGTSLVESSRFGVQSVGCDLNPVAWFVTKKEIEAGETKIENLDTAFEKVKEDVADTISEYYKTSCPNGDDGHKADVMYNFWVKELDCVSCSATVPLFKDYRVGKGRYDSDDMYNVLCPSCEEVIQVEDWRESSTCDNCNHTFVPEDGNAGGGDYMCHSCGQQYPIMDAIQEQDGFDTRLYALEYYCKECDDRGRDRSDYKGYTSADQMAKDLWSKAKANLESSESLHKYIPDEEIPLGIKTDSSKFEGNITGGHNVLRHGYTYWKDMFNQRQLLCLAKILESIDEIQDQTAKEYLLLALSDSLMFQNTFTIYNLSANKIEGVFKSNSFDPQLDFVENNVWGTEYGRGTFEKSWEKLIKGVEYAHNPTERYIDEDGNTAKTPPYQKAIGDGASVNLGDMRQMEDEEYDAVITDPPYYDNVIYSELSDFFYVWQKQLLKDQYEGFGSDRTPHSESIVANPAEQKGAEEFEDELREAFSKIKNNLKQDGVLAFTYHHSDSESWGELLQALCDVGFEVTATYPITSDLSRLVEGESVSFDIIMVARPAGDRNPISWNSLRRNIYRTAQKTRKRLEENRDLSRGDIGVVEMGRCFHEYSKHHGKVERAGDTMTAKDVVSEIYGIITPGNEIGEIDVFLDLLETPSPSFNDLNKLSRGTNATPERMEDMRLYRMDDGFTLGTWDDEKRIAYIQSRVDSDEELTDLNKAQFLRYRWEHGKSVSEYLGKWEITDDLRELCEGLADATGDDTYRNILESRLSDY